MPSIFKPWTTSVAYPWLIKYSCKNFAYVDFPLASKPQKHINFPSIIIIILSRMFLSPESKGFPTSMPLGIFILLQRSSNAPFKILIPLFKYSAFEWSEMVWGRYWNRNSAQATLAGSHRAPQNPQWSATGICSMWPLYAPRSNWGFKILQKQSKDGSCWYNDAVGSYRTYRHSQSGLRIISPY